jgi:hypothetical protein
MKTYLSRRIPVVVAASLALAMLALGFLAALGARSLVAGTASASPDPPNPGHSWSEIGDFPGTMWHSNNDGPGSGLDADTLDGLDSTAFTSLPWSAITSKPAGFADDIDNDILGGLSCANGQIAKWNGSAWQCAADNTGAGTFWSLTGNSGTVPGTNFLGTADNQALELRVNGSRALRLEPGGTIGGPAIPNVIGGYSGNWVNWYARGATIAGGGDAYAPPSYFNRVTDDHGTVGGGSGNQAGDNAGWVGDAVWNTVGGGVNNTASSGMYGTVSGGGGNTASGFGGATVGGGGNNTASGIYSTVPGGIDNTAAGHYSLAAGRRARANNEGCFVWGDSTDADVACNDNNRFIARASGGVYLYSNSTLTTGAYLAAGSGSWSSVSDRNLKENFTPVDGQQVLTSLAEIPITTWNYKAQENSIRHMGPVAQDFYAAFALGESETAISTVDADGVALAAIQGLYQLSQEQAAQIQALQAENASLQQRLSGVEARVTALEGGAGLNGGSSSPVLLGLSAMWLLPAGLLIIGLVLGQRRVLGGGDRRCGHWR